MDLVLKLNLKRHIVFNKLLKKKYSPKNLQYDLLDSSLWLKDSFSKNVLDRRTRLFNVDKYGPDFFIRVKYN